MRSGFEIQPLACPARQNIELVRACHLKVIHLPFVKEMLDGMQYPAVIIDADRQILLVNTTLSEMLGITRADDYLGMRPGELLGCVNSSTAAGGCGTSEGCSVCGGVLSMLESFQRQTRITREMRVNTQRAGQMTAFDFQVSVLPLNACGEHWAVLTLMDISHLKRRQNLERLFFHDILNTASNALALSRVMSEMAPDIEQEYLDLNHANALQLVEQIKAQRQLLDAENNELTPRFEVVQTLDCLRQTAGMYQQHKNAYQVEIRIDPGSKEATITSDKALLLRVLYNLVQNALEASLPGQVVTLGSRREKNWVHLWVHNEKTFPGKCSCSFSSVPFPPRGSDGGWEPTASNCLASSISRAGWPLNALPGKGPASLSPFRLIQARPEVHRRARRQFRRERA